MINANELRIGNWVNLGRKIVQVEGWMFIQECKNMEPILLAPEIIKSCGFISGQLHMTSHGVCSDGLFIGSGSDGVFLAYNYDDCAYFSHNTEFETKIEYLHQLQNLYFAITGKEIEVNFKVSHIQSQ